MPRTKPAPGAEPESRPAPVVRPVRVPAERGWASQPSGLEWRAVAPLHLPGAADWRGRWLMAQTPIGRWSVQLMPHEVRAWVEPRECGLPRYEVGSFPTPEAAMQACQLDFRRRLALQEAAAAALMPEERPAGSGENPPATSKEQSTMPRALDARSEPMLFGARPRGHLRLEGSRRKEPRLPAN